MVVSKIVILPSLKIAPPADVAELPSNWEVLIAEVLSVPLRMAPPLPPALLFEKVTFVVVSVPLSR